MFQKYTIKDIVFLAILSAVLLLVSGLIMPLVMLTQIYGLRQLFSAPLFALFVMIALQKVPKLGALTFVGLFTGTVLLFMSPIMFFNNFCSALLVEVLILLLFRNYEHEKARYVAASLYIPLTLPITLLVTSWMRGISIVDQLGSNHWLTVGMVAGTILLSIGGALLGGKIAKELRKAGKL